MRNRLSVSGKIPGFEHISSIVVNKYELRPLFAGKCDANAKHGIMYAEATNQ